VLHRPPALALVRLLTAYPEAATATNRVLADLLDCSPRSVRHGLQAATEAGWTGATYAVSPDSGKIARTITVTAAGVQAVTRDA
jgi:hypothetical protein